MNYIKDRIARGITRPSTFETVMPGWNGEESMMGYVIRTRREREARAKARRDRIRNVLIVANLVVWPVAGLVAVALVQSLFPW